MTTRQATRDASTPAAPGPRTLLAPVLCQLAGQVQNRQKNRLGDIAVKVQLS